MVVLQYYDCTLLHWYDCDVMAWFLNHDGMVLLNHDGMVLLNHDGMVLLNHDGVSSAGWLNPWSVDRRCLVGIYVFMCLNQMHTHIWRPLSYS